MKPRHCGGHVCGVYSGQVAANIERNFVASRVSPRRVPPLIRPYAESTRDGGSKSMMAAQLSMLPSVKCRPLLVTSNRVSPPLWPVVAYADRIGAADGGSVCGRPPQQEHEGHLWDDGNVGSPIEVKSFWNSLDVGLSVSRYGGYPSTRGIRRAARPRCTHDASLPAEVPTVVDRSYATADPQRRALRPLLARLAGLALLLLARRSARTPRRSGRIPRLLLFSHVRSVRQQQYWHHWPSLFAKRARGSINEWGSPVDAMRHWAARSLSGTVT
jgi:hypothetical protein